MRHILTCVGKCTYYNCERFGSCDYYVTSCSWDDICIGRRTYNNFDETISGEWCIVPKLSDKNLSFTTYTLVARTNTQYFYCIEYEYVPKRTFAPSPPRTFAPTPPRTYAAPPTCAKAKNKLKVQVVYAFILN